MFLTGPFYRPIGPSLLRSLTASLLKERFKELSVIFCIQELDNLSLLVLDQLLEGLVQNGTKLDLHWYYHSSGFALARETAEFLGNKQEINLRLRPLPEQPCKACLDPLCLHHNLLLPSLPTKASFRQT
ncbi:MAG: hypothetical protein A2600_09515 [Candidatus Lambdaproteobacteria bacterium RIFOXYD1_FULL_56_27]|uniref:Uncharacterized protein n=1 Tax=Candidatus Lambdaproteobacteria bacterium RIFOXYD2_FULL_56_26 TaxID=1817773 RepID=A0A1F6GUQ3_9PROT|nr:MAG: hypothetical protein A2557_04785 [Candidatus Lambdaproteobacteria bacterium RIFOXYD2_FULL_56_26]OGH02286.1 MAG: hypothetical protein A2426_03265 [Candidatus Lambdaproteobacteria bacterium RIFOXYC1_FULL_56_13]OGH10056.1 MAG: hypothetical protein A2600_09515 [Candidatus Lambdaproteobacteria bacterium RIFOXYD1_FULL_56_27]